MDARRKRTHPLLIPGYWPNETSGVLAPAILAYLHDQPLTPAQVGAIRAYIRQWMRGDYLGVEELTAKIDAIQTREDLHRWFDEALELGIDPL